MTHYQTVAAAAAAAEMPAHSAAAAHHAESSERIKDVFEGIPAAEKLAKYVEGISESERGENVLVLIWEGGEMVVVLVVAAVGMSGASRPPAASAGGESFPAMLVVDLSLLLVGKDLVRLRDLFELSATTKSTHNETRKAGTVFRVRI